MRIIGPTTGEELIRQHAIEIKRLKSQLGTLHRDKVYPTDQRPDPVDRAGAHIFDQGLGKPIWSTGEGWVDAMGNPV